VSDLKIQAPSDLVSADLPKLNGKTSSKESAKQFEGLLMAQLFQSLRKTVKPSGLFGDEGKARETYEYLFDQAVVSHAMAAGKGWGLAERIERSWTQTNPARDLKESEKLPI